MSVRHDAIDRRDRPGPAWAAGARARAGAHDRAARAAALDDGLLAEEVDQILAGRRIVEAFPVERGESPPTYATRAVAEMMAAYLA
ncbi:hypothetical protein U8607_15510 [Methylobacterium durans]|uniref:hypothetical protein n=1 Tax=Methylobacterium durans TaxID=2202825 RepID=UPI002AFE4110|nr:hypothetical protein [Methylobacterium durans]MEA1833492.1 hypothetical protein [Methylobacterium durans]